MSKHVFSLALLVIHSLAQAAGSAPPSSAGCNVNVSANEIAAIMNRYVTAGANGRGPAAALYRFNSGGAVAQTVYERNAHVAQPIASTQKILTAWTAYRLGNLSREVAFSDDDLFYDEQGIRAKHPNGTTVLVGERLTLSEAMRTMIVQSSNGGAHALARGASGSIGTFMAKMNAEALAILGSSAKSYFQNPSGLTDSSSTYRFTGTTRTQLSTAAELAKIAGKIMQTSGFRSALANSGVEGTRDGYLYKLGSTNAAGRTIVVTFPLRNACSGQLAALTFFGSSASDQSQRFQKAVEEIRALVWSRK